jgi:sigma-B regulation protein RsbU (phosphoserine phosphatase)
MLCRQFAIAIENALYHKESLAQERMKQELEIAASVQKSFLPDLPFFSKGSITMSAANIPAAQVGGDLYDFIELTDGKIGILIGDVSGKGISAALFMAKAISDFRHVVHLAESPGHLLQLLNAMLSRAPHGMFMTALYLVVDTSTGKIEAARAGHPPPLLVQGDAVTIMDIPAGPPLGILETEYSDSSFFLKGSDRLLLFTDGCFEARDRSGRRTDFHAFVRFVREHCGEQQLTRKVVDFVHDFSGGAALADDVTIIEVVHQEQ